jgi:quinol monooxygenase YgiN
LLVMGIVAILRVKPGKTEEFERVFTALAGQVRANESGNIAYQLCRSRTEPGTYKVLEFYRDEEALAAHRASAHFREAGPALGALLDGRPEVEVLDAVG